jgi:2-polyprenyl-3-methyl-5-hydroxy-6-metoxy-1,4-benzoquinol methylase
VTVALASNGLRALLFFWDERPHTEHSDLADLYNAKYYESAFYDYTDSRLDTLITLAKPAKGKRILDLGCGPGEVAVRCAKLGAEVFGVDIARDALRLSGRRCTREGVRIWLFEFEDRKSTRLNSSHEVGC